MTNIKKKIIKNHEREIVFGKSVFDLLNNAR